MIVSSKLLRRGSSLIRMSGINGSIPITSTTTTVAATSTTTTAAADALQYSTSACCSANHINEQKKQIEQLQHHLEATANIKTEFCNLDSQNHLKKCASLDNNNNNNNNNKDNPVIPSVTPPQQQTPSQLKETQSQLQPTKPVKQKPSFYQRPLPAHLIAFSSEEGRKIFRESLQDGHMEGYFSLAEQFVSQSEPAFCGLATLAMVLNALKIDPKRLWKGPWRWFAEDMLDCCAPIETVKKRGITFIEFACLSKCNGANITSIRGDEANIEQFRKDIIEACSKQNEHLVISYDRKVLGQTGSGHYSPIGGYHEERDLALVLDVARFKYAPHWVPVQVLFDAMKVNDPETQKPRGYFKIKSDPSYEPSFCHVKNTLSWAAIADKFAKTLPEIIETSNPQTIQDVIRTTFKNLPPESIYVLCAYSHELHKKLVSPDSRMTWVSFFEEISKSQAHKLLDEMIRSGQVDWSITHQHDSSQQLRDICHNYPVGLATIIFLAFPSSFFNQLPYVLRDEMSSVRNLDSLKSEVVHELLTIRQEMFDVKHTPCFCSEGGNSEQCKMKQHNPTAEQQNSQQHHQLNQHL